ncbi:MAG: DUF2267 domain-containing protein [Dehalococcoidia bacterium]
MTRTGIEGINETIEKTHVWLNEIAEELGAPGDKHYAYGALTAVLPAIRDHLNPDEAAHLSAQLPVLVRGLFFDGWDPSKTPVRERTREAFLERVAERAAPDVADRPEPCVRAVAKVLAKHISAGELKDVMGMLPEPVRDLLA